MRWTIFCLATIFMTAGCSSSTGSGTPSVNLAGTYSGTSSDSIGGSGSFIIGIDGSGSQVTGRWGDVYPKTHHVSVGTFSGSVSGNVLRATATSVVKGECRLSMVASLDGSALDGSYQGVGAGCSAEKGTFTMPSITPSRLADSRPFHGTVDDDRFGKGAAKIDPGNIQPPFVNGTFSFAYSHNQSGHVSGWITETNLAHFIFMVKKRAGELAECEMVVVGGRYVPNKSLDAAYESQEILPCLFKDRYGKFDVTR
jgi:hypothetical protein